MSQGHHNGVGEHRTSLITGNDEEEEEEEYETDDDDDDDENDLTNDAVAETLAEDDGSLFRQNSKQEDEVVVHILDADSKIDLGGSLQRNTAYPTMVSPPLSQRLKLPITSGACAIKNSAYMQSTQKRSELGYTCKECGKTFKQKTNLLHHIRTHTGEKPFQCETCGKCFSQKRNLVNHHRTHSGERPFQCEICNKTFTQKRGLKDHIRRHAGEKPWQCDQCEKTFTHKRILQDHMRSHTGERPWKCEECGKDFAVKRNLVNHMRVHTGEKPYHCERCGKDFSHMRNLIDHVRRHTGEKPFKCSECGKEFAQARNLIDHYRIHTGERPFKCEVCGKDYTTKRSLVIHMNLHTTSDDTGKDSMSNGTSTSAGVAVINPKPFHCTECGKEFAAKRSLVLHMRTHTGEKPFLCSFGCGKSFCQKRNMLNHVRAIHTKERPFVCVQCGADFTNRRSLTNHEQRIHGSASGAEQGGSSSILGNGHSFISGESSVQIKLEMDPEEVFGGKEELVMARMEALSASGKGMGDLSSLDMRMKSDDEISFTSMCSETSLDIPLDKATSERLAGMASRKL